MAQIYGNEIESIVKDYYDNSLQQLNRHIYINEQGEYEHDISDFILKKGDYFNTFITVHTIGIPNGVTLKLCDENSKPLYSPVDTNNNWITTQCLITVGETDIIQLPAQFNAQLSNHTPFPAETYNWKLIFSGDEYYNGKELPLTVEIRDFKVWDILTPKIYPNEDIKVKLKTYGDTYYPAHSIDSFNLRYTNCTRYNPTFTDEYVHEKWDNYILENGVLYMGGTDTSLFLDLNNFNKTLFIKKIDDSAGGLDFVFKVDGSYTYHTMINNTVYIIENNDNIIKIKTENREYAPEINIQSIGFRNEEHESAVTIWAADENLGNTFLTRNTTYNESTGVITYPNSDLNDLTVGKHMQIINQENKCTIDYEIKNPFEIREVSTSRQYSTNNQVILLASFQTIYRESDNRAIHAVDTYPDIYINNTSLPVVEGNWSHSNGYGKVYSGINFPPGTYNIEATARYQPNQLFYTATKTMVVTTENCSINLEADESSNIVATYLHNNTTPIPNATIYIKELDSNSIIYTGKTDTKGQVETNHEQGRYQAIVKDNYTNEDLLYSNIFSIGDPYLNDITISNNNLMTTYGFDAPINEIDINDNGDLILTLNTQTNHINDVYIDENGNLFYRSE